MTNLRLDYSVDGLRVEMSEIQDTIQAQNGSLFWTSLYLTADLEPNYPMPAIALDVKFKMKDNYDCPSAIGIYERETKRCVFFEF